MPVQSSEFAGGFLSSFSHHTVLSSRLSPTFVKIVFFLVAARALGFDFSLVPGATPKNPFSGFVAQSLPSSPILIQAISCNLPSVFSVSFRWYKHRQICFAACGRECRCNVSLFSLRIFYAEDKHMLSHPAFLLSKI